MKLSLNTRFFGLTLNVEYNYSCRQRNIAECFLISQTPTNDVAIYLNLMVSTLVCLVMRL